MTEKEKMISGKLYCPEDAELKALRQKAHRLSMEYNQTAETEAERREAILAELVPERGKNVYLQGPVQFDYGVFTSIGENSYANFNFTVLDCAPVKIGDNVWIGENLVILAGASIGDGCIVGANSVITGSIPDHCIVVGNNKIIKQYDQSTKSWERYRGQLS